MPKTKSYNTNAYPSLQLGMVNEFDLVGRPYLCGATPRVRSVCLNDHSDGRKILIGTACSEVRQVNKRTPSRLEHHRGEGVF